MMNRGMRENRRNGGVWPVAAVVLAGLGSSGCYNAEAVKAFLQKPPRPVAGVEYRVYPPDVISIASREVPEINGASQRIRPDGKVNLPLLGEIFVAGKTPKEIELALGKAAEKYYEQVDATVTVSAYNSQRFYLFGQVGRPGPMPWTGRDTLLDALAQAQPTTLAWPERIWLIRSTKPQVGGSAPPEPRPRRYRMFGVHTPPKHKPPTKMCVNLMAMVKSGDLSKNVLLMPNDVIYVQPNPLAAIGLAVQNLLFPVRPAMEAAGTPARIATVGSTP